MSQYLSPRNDYGFKKLFGCEDHVNLTMSFLNAILNRVEGNLITEITFRQTEKFPEPAGGRRSFLDVYCVDQHDHHFIIEMSSFANLYGYKFNFDAASADTADKHLQEGGSASSFSGGGPFIY